MSRIALGAVFAVLAAILAGCSSSFFDTEGVAYKSAGKLPPLEIPPDLSSPTSDDRFRVPDVNPTGTATLSTYSAERTPRAGSTAILPDTGKVKLERDGSERWIVVPEPPEKVWPVVKEFWQERGFLIKIEVPEAGIMETDWAEQRAQLPDEPFRNFMTRVLGSIYSNAEREKFRTRLERGSQPDTTEIYISNRGLVEVYTNNQYPSQVDGSTVWQWRPPNPGLEAEFLRRLMVRFGADDVRARAELAEVKKDERAKIARAEDGAAMLELTEPFDRAWRRVGLALDRVGFTVEDRDRSKGLYFVRYLDSVGDGKEKKDDGFLSSLAFWRSSKSDAKAEQYRVLVKNHNDGSEVQVLNKEGNADGSDTARKILSLLHEQLK